MAGRKSATITVKGRRGTRREFLGVLGGVGAGLAAGVLGRNASQAAPKPTVAHAPAVVSSGAKQIVVSVWGGVSEEGMRKAVSPVFEKKYNATVAYDIGGGAPRFSKIRAQASNPQVTVFLNSDILIYAATTEGLLAPLNPTNIPNLRNLYEWARPKEFGSHAVGFTVIAAGLTVAKNKVKVPVTSWKDLWRDEFKGKLAFYSPSTTTAMELLIIASELHGGNQNNIEPGLKALAELRPIKLVTFWTDYASLLKSGEVVVATELDYYTLFMQREGYDVSFVVPREKAIGQVSAAGVVKGGPNQELGEAYIDTLLDPGVQSGLAREAFNPPTNKLVKLDHPLSELVMYGSRLEKSRWFDLKAIVKNRDQWTERLNTEVVPKWRL